MKNRTTFLLAFAAALLITGGCGSDPERIDPSGNSGLTTTHDINFKDWQTAAETCINSMLQSGVLTRPDGRKTVLMISLVKNKTSQHIDTEILTDKIRQAVLRSGKAVTTTAVGANGPEDKASKQVRDLQDDDMFNQNTVQKMGTTIAPDMSLAGEIIQQKTNLGRNTESYFFFHMTLTDLSTGLAVWEDNVEIAKQSKRPYFGY